ncbi:hypothetical protein PTTG_25396 [Puccinia triticina 1-1 BBBD Race 1]|uniref:Retrotransposon gag domain-containing protein n=1 Tax=Puccinia triticina (isolate 1-1 / race 1 (BBBD)) TaxID=630390 RepID=A0A180H4T0_PUCT1|nr:hypothetical protein PTTG_25396 [Puccinia triticina 1-1 BBBD Race 1]
MTTRNSNSGPLLPISDPEEILRAARRRARLDALAASNNAAIAQALLEIEQAPSNSRPETPSDHPNYDPTVPDPPTERTINPGSNPAVNQPEEVEEDLSITDSLKAILTIQKNTALQFQAAQKQAEEQRHIDAEQRRLDAEQRKAEADRFAEQRKIDCERIKALEKAALTGGIKQEVAPTPHPGRVDLPKFRTSDGPQFNGPLQNAEVFLTWIQAVTIFFDTKAVTHADDKRLILGSLISDTNLTAFYRVESPKFAGKLWEEFRDRLFEFCLPEDWRADLRQSIVCLEMSGSESFLQYSSRARTLQSLVNFEKDVFDDLDLAEFVVLGLPHVLQSKVRDFQLLLQKPFKYGAFENRISGFYINLPRNRQPSYRFVATGANATPLGSNRLEPNLYLWKMHAYLDSVGKCHFCKKHCGNPAGVCPGPPDRSRVYIPPEFQVPPKPPNYVAPWAWSNANQKPTNPTAAGRPTGKPAGVAGMDEAPPFEHSQVSLVSAIDGQLEATALAYGDQPLNEIEIEDQLAPKSDDKACLLPEEPTNTSDLMDVHAIDNKVESILDKWFPVDSNGTTEPTSTAKDPSTTATEGSINSRDQ